MLKCYKAHEEKLAFPWKSQCKYIKVGGDSEIWQISNIKLDYKFQHSKVPRK